MDVIKFERKNPRNQVPKYEYGDMIEDATYKIGCVFMQLISNKVLCFNKPPIPGDKYFQLFEAHLDKAKATTEIKQKITDIITAMLNT